MTVQNTEGRGLRPGFLICAHDCASGGGLDRGLAAEHGSGDERNDKADGQRFHESVGHVDEGILVELLGVLNDGDAAAVVAGSSPEDWTL